MNEQRIYDKMVAIDTRKVKSFYNQQAAKPQDKRSAVFLGSQSPDILEQKDSYWRDHILPLLGVGKDTRVLDLGCGNGRLAEFMLPSCGHYCGVDFSDEMIKGAEQTCNRQGGSFQIHCMSVVDAVAQEVAFYGGAFDLVIISGVLMYLNDPDVERIFQCLPGLLTEKCTLFVGDPVGLGRRMTLNDFPSETLHTDYSAIYRTPVEYSAFFAPLMDIGLNVIKSEFMPKFGEQYTDTARHYTILRR